MAWLPLNIPMSRPHVLSKMAGIDVLYLANNQPISDPATRKAIFDFVDAGKGLVLAHPAIWYNWKDWPEYNQKLVGGGSRGHNKYGPFDVTVTNQAHPIMKGVPLPSTSMMNCITSSRTPPVRPLRY